MRSTLNHFGTLLTATAAVALLAGCVGPGSRQSQLEEQLIAAETDRARMASQLQELQRQASQARAEAAASKQQANRRPVGQARPVPPPVAPTISARPATQSSITARAPAGAPSLPTYAQGAPVRPYVPGQQPRYNAPAEPQVVLPNTQPRQPAAARQTAANRAAPARLPSQTNLPPAQTPVNQPGFSQADLPPNPRAGECYARLYYPPSYETRTERVLSQEAYEKVEIIPAEYGVAEERVLTKAAYEKVVEVLPPVYETVTEDVVIRPAYEKVEQVPPQYNDIEEKILVRAAYTQWKQGRGPVEKFDQATGEIMCLVEVPAEYKTVKKRVLVSPATTKRTVVPPELEQVEKRILVRPAQVVKETVPAEYKSIKVRRITAPARERRVPVAAEYEDVQKKIKVTEGRTVWRSVLCETNMNGATVTSIQRALLKAGFNPGAIDGVIGKDTMKAAGSFQRARGLPQGSLSMETLRALGVTL